MSGWKHTGCCCGKKRPCRDCGPYGSTCCLKITGLGETWYFRTTIHSLTLSAPGCAMGGGLQVYDKWVDTDDVNEAYLNIGFGAQSNLCGGLSTAGPCILYGRIDDDTDLLRPPLNIVWNTSSDCRKVNLILDYRDAAGVLTRYTATTTPDWITAGRTITIGPFTLTQCPPGEPPAKVYNICCTQAVCTAPAGAFTSKSGHEGTPPVCSYDPRFQCVPTEQCRTVEHLGSDFYWDRSKDSSSVIGSADYSYEVSSDYTTIHIKFRAFIAGDESNSYAWLFTSDGTVSGGPIVITLPWTPTWWDTPLVIAATGAIGGASASDCSVTISVCGYDNPTETPCLEQLVYSTISNHGAAPSTYGLSHPLRQVDIFVTPVGATLPWIVHWTLTPVGSPVSGVQSWTLRVWGNDTAPLPNDGSFDESYTVTSTCNSSEDLVLSAHIPDIDAAFFGFTIDLFTTL